MKRFLHLQISLSLAVGALFMSLLAAWYVYTTTYHEELQRARQAAEELIDTVASSATIACYLNQEDMLREVAKSLVNNQIIALAKLTTTQGAEVIEGNSGKEAQDFTLKRDLISPFGETGNVKVGELVILQNQEIIEARAVQISRNNALALILIAGLVAIFAAVFIYYQITLPIKTAATALHRIPPGDSARLEVPARHKNNELGTLIQDINNLLENTSGTIASERALRKNFEALEEQYRNIFEKASSAIFLAEFDGNISISNQKYSQFAAISGKREAAHNNFIHLFADEMEAKRLFNLAIERNRPISADLRINKEENPIWVHAIFSRNSQKMIEGILYDITKRRLLETKTKKQAEQDHLTGLNNRMGVETRLRQTLTFHPEKAPKSITMFLLDLDGFKDINDTWGHDTGDIILQHVAKRLVTINRTSDIVARWGGDEFVLVIYDLSNKLDCFSIGRKIWKTLSQPIELGRGKTGYIGASIGVCTLDYNMFSKELLIKSADRAMYKVKNAGKNGVCYFDARNDTFELMMFDKNRSV